jgi:Multicopper oxidase
MALRNIYLKIERIRGYSPVAPADHVTPPIQYGRDCMRNEGHEDGSIPADEIAARRLAALVYREYLDPTYLVPKPDKLVAADINKPPFPHRVPGTVIYSRPGDRLRIHVKNADNTPHSFHLHGLHYGIESDGSWPFGTQSADGRRSDEICPGDRWTYIFDVKNDTIGVWPFHDHWRDIGTYINRGLFGGLVVLAPRDLEHLPHFPLPPNFEKDIDRILKELERERHHKPQRPRRHRQQEASTEDGREDEDVAAHRMAMPTPAGMSMNAVMTMGGAMPVPGSVSGHSHGLDLSELPPGLVPYVATLEELAHAPQPLPPHTHTLHVPLFFHQMSGRRGTPVFQSAPLTGGATYISSPFTLAAEYHYHCGFHGQMTGTVAVRAGGRVPPTSKSSTSRSCRPTLSSGSVVRSSGFPRVTPRSQAHARGRHSRPRHREGVSFVE